MTEQNKKGANDSQGVKGQGEEMGFQKGFKRPELSLRLV